MSVPRSICLLGAATVALNLTGCLLFEPWADFWHEMKRTSVPRAEDRRDFTENSQEDWSVVKKEARKDQVAEKDPDPWYRQYVLSEKAREIEENLGFE